MRQALVVTESPLSGVLAGAGLAVRSFLKLISTETGYDSHNLLTFTLTTIRKAVQAESFYSACLSGQRDSRSNLRRYVSFYSPGGGEVDGPSSPLTIQTSIPTVLRHHFNPSILDISAPCACPARGPRFPVRTFPAHSRRHLE